MTTYTAIIKGEAWESKPNATLGELAEHVAGKMEQLRYATAIERCDPDGSVYGATLAEVAAFNDMLRDSYDEAMKDMHVAKENERLER